jgi:hypothetical protein
MVHIFIDTHIQHGSHFQRYSHTTWFTCSKIFTYIIVHIFIDIHIHHGSHFQRYSHTSWFTFSQILAPNVFRNFTHLYNYKYTTRFISLCLSVIHLSLELPLTKTFFTFSHTFTHMHTQEHIHITTSNINCVHKSNAQIPLWKTATNDTMLTGKKTECALLQTSHTQ